MRINILFIYYSSILVTNDNNNGNKDIKSLKKLFLT